MYKIVSLIDLVNVTINNIDKYQSVFFKQQYNDKYEQKQIQKGNSDWENSGGGIYIIELTVLIFSSR